MNEKYKGYLESFGRWILDLILNHPFWAIFGFFMFVVFMMLMSHKYDITEGNFRNGMIIFLFLIFLGFSIVVFLLALQNGTLNLWG